MGTSSLTGGSHTAAWLLAARILMASLFIFSGLEKILIYQDAVQFASGGGVPFAPELMPLAILLELGCGAMLLLGWHARLAAMIFAAWVLVLGPSFHRFWAEPPATWQVVVDGFFHHLVMAGGFICLAVCGPGDLSLDAKSGR
jgi:putative oxidoreductase